MRAGVHVFHFRRHREHVNGIQVGRVQFSGALANALLENFIVVLEIHRLLKGAVAHLHDELEVLLERALRLLLLRDIDHRDESKIAQRRRCGYLS